MRRPHFPHSPRFIQILMWLLTATGVAIALELIFRKQW
jgi:hypothetical protein